MWRWKSSGKLDYTEGGGISVLRKVVIASRHFLIFQKTWLFISTTVRTPNIALVNLSFNFSSTTVKVQCGYWVIAPRTVKSDSLDVCTYSQGNILCLYSSAYCRYGAYAWTRSLVWTLLRKHNEEYVTGFWLEHDYPCSVNMMLGPNKNEWQSTLITSWSGVLQEQLILPRPVQKFSHFVEPDCSLPEKNKIQ